MSKKDDENRFIKCVLVGDACVGKTCMLKTYTTNIYPTDVYPGGWDNYTVTVTIGETSYQLGLFDTCGLEDYDRRRPLTYPGTHVFLLCYSVVNPTSFGSVLEKWLPEVQHCSPTSAFLIVGTQTDLRDDASTLDRLRKNRQKPVTHEECAELAKQVNADGYVECSSKTQQSLKDVFDEAILAVLSPKIKRRAPRRGLRKCVIL